MFVVAARCDAKFREEAAVVTAIGYEADEFAQGIVLFSVFVIMGFSRFVFHGMRLLSDRILFLFL